MQVWKVVAVLLTTCGVLLAQEHSDERLDAIGYELMSRAGAVPVECPRDVLAGSRYSILFCGSLKRRGAASVAEVRGAADALVLGSGPGPFRGAVTDWEKYRGWFQRAYYSHDAIVTVGVRRNPEIVFLQYPWQFPDCLANPPLPRESVRESTAPRIIEESRRGVRPRYPAIARVARIEAAVFLQGRISKEGDLVDLCVQHVTRPDFGFEQAALEAVRQWRYEPATVDGEPIELKFSITVDFALH